MNLYVRSLHALAATLALLIPAAAADVEASASKLDRALPSN